MTTKKTTTEAHEISPLRDYIAAAALTGLIAYHGLDSGIDFEMVAYSFADKMLIEREKER